MVITLPLVVYLMINFVLLFAFLKTVDPRKWLVGLISLILTPVIYFYVFYPFLNIISSYHHQKYFNSENWKTNPGLRFEMIDQMPTDSTLIGLSKNETKSILGPAEWYSWDDALKQHDSSKWNYGLGIEPGALNTKKLNGLFTFKDGKLTEISSYEEDITYDSNNE